MDSSDFLVLIKGSRLGCRGGTNVGCQVGQQVVVAGEDVLRLIRLGPWVEFVVLCGWNALRIGRRGVVFHGSRGWSTARGEFQSAV